MNAMAKRSSYKKETGTFVDDNFAKYVKKCKNNNSCNAEHRKNNPENIITKKIQDTRGGLLMSYGKPNPKLLLVFNIADLTYDAFNRAAEKVGFDVTHSNSTDIAFDEFQSKHHDLVAIDTRSIRSADYEVLCRGIRTLKGSQHTVMIAIVKRSIFERNNGEILNLLEFGFHRCIVENPNVINYINELVQLKLCDIKMMAQKCTAQALYTALDKCNKLVFITDENYKCQYVNAAIEKILNMHQAEILGKTLMESIINDQVQLSTVTTTLLRGKEWIGQLLMTNKNRDKVTTQCNVIPVTCYGRAPTHFVLIAEVCSNPKVSHSSRMSLSSEKRRSTEFRKSSLHKMRSFIVDTPLARATTILDHLKEKVGQNSELLPLLDEVDDLLKKSEFYSSPEIKRAKPEEPIVSDLISALLSDQTMGTQHVSSIRRSSADVSVRYSKIKHQSADLDEILDRALRWDFEIFRLESVSKNRPLQHLGMHLCQHFDIAGSLNCDEKTLQNWFIIIESHYHSSNFYHNSTHGADVMQATAGFLEKDRIKCIMEPLDEAMCLLAAAAHDVDHPGKSSAFLANSDNILAVLYNDITILENHHAACMFKLTLGDERVNVFQNLDRETYKVVRHCMIDMILATEMTKHFEHLTKFVNVFCTEADDDDDNNNSSSDYITLSLPENITLIKRMLIKCADVSNPTRPFRLYVEWTRRIAEEYFQQTDEEKVKGLPVVMPMFDRNTCSIPKSQIGFVDFIVNDMFEAWNAFIDMPEMIAYLRQNYVKWKEFDEQGHKTLADINNLLSNNLLSPSLLAEPNKH